ncbi:MAG: hydrogenase maturation nickel metallochaperone HypA [Glaciecola sp.]|jgi:hydrogenase nickel incorporation protein HypA/HybF
MHEMSLCEGVLQVIEDAAKAQSFDKVKTVWLEVGSLSGVEIKALEFCFEVVCRNSVAHDAALEIIESPAQAWCMQCAESVVINQRYDPCPMCEGHQLQVTGGDEMRIKELEVV